LAEIVVVFSIYTYAFYLAVIFSCFDLLELFVFSCAVNNIFSAAPSREMVRAKFPFDATSDKQLSMKVGDVITVLEKSASGWYKGESNGAVGLFPSNYTEPL